MQDLLDAWRPQAQLFAKAATPDVMMCLFPNMILELGLLPFTQLTSVWGIAAYPAFVPVFGPFSEQVDPEFFTSIVFCEHTTHLHPPPLSPPIFHHVF